MIKIKSGKKLLLERARERNDVKRAKAVSERKNSFRKLDFSALRCEQM